VLHCIFPRELQSSMYFQIEEPAEQKEKRRNALARAAVVDRWREACRAPGCTNSNLSDGYLATPSYFLREGKAVRAEFGENCLSAHHVDGVEPVLRALGEMQQVQFGCFSSNNATSPK
jgi:hypothetical protein